MTVTASVQDLLTAFAALSDQELHSLRRAARALLEGTQYTEPADLLHEALSRCLSGSRSWPKNVPFPVFMSNAMRSIAGADRRTKSAKTTRPESNFVTETFFEPLSYFAPRTPSAEDAYIAMLERDQVQREVDQLREAVDHDETARTVLAGWLAGLNARDIRARNGLSVESYEAARKRLNRRVAALRRLDEDDLE